MKSAGARLQKPPSKAKEEEDLAQSIWESNREQRVFPDNMGFWGSGSRMASKVVSVVLFGDKSFGYAEDKLLMQHVHRHKGRKGRQGLELLDTIAAEFFIWSALFEPNENYLSLYSLFLP